MKQFIKIFNFELKNYLANKVFVGVTLFLVVVIAAVMFAPRVIEMLDPSDTLPPESDDGDIIIDDPDMNGDTDDASDLPVMLIAGEDKEYSESIREAFATAFFDYSVTVTDAELDNIKEKIVSGEAECAFVMNGPTSYTYYVNNLSMYDSNTVVADEVLRNLYQMGALMGSGISADDAQAILSAYIEHETETLGKDQMSNFFYTYIMIFALYMVILLYGQMVATNVATEKSSRAMELLVTSAKPTSMMFGKVLASCLAGFLQLLTVFGTSFVCFNLNKAYWDEGGIVSSIFNMPLELLIYMLIFFVLGFFIYAFMFGAVGSTASKLEDINTSVMPITMIFVFAFMVVIFSLAGNTVDTLLMKICSYIPFTSPMAMFTRIAMSTVPFYEIAISIVILIGSVIGIGVLSAKIYRVGVLLYGTPPKLGAIIKAIKRA